MVEPIHPFKRRELHGFEVAPRATMTDDFGLVQPDHRLGEGVIKRIPDAPHRQVDAGVSQPVGVPNRQTIFPWTLSSQMMEPLESQGRFMDALCYHYVSVCAVKGERTWVI